MEICFGPIIRTEKNAVWICMDSSRISHTYYTSLLHRWGHQWKLPTLVVTKCSYIMFHTILRRSFVLHEIKGRCPGSQTKAYSTQEES